MGLPAIAILLAPATCFPAWYERYRVFETDTPRVRSGASTVNGNVQARPEDLARAASQAIGRNVSVEAYTLARYLSSEVGSGTLGEKVAVAQNALNRVRYIEPRVKTATNLLLYRQASGHPNRGFYGPIHGSAGVSSAPYGRWAATSRDPSVGDLHIALGVLSGDIDPSFSKGADDQMGPEHLNDPVASVVSHGKNRRQYWVGPIPGVDPWHTIQYRTIKDLDPSSALGQTLIARGVAAMKAARPDWSKTPICSEESVLPRLLLGFGATILAGAGFAATRQLERRVGF